MLKCIPYLFDFSNVGDDEYRENIIAAAVILQQYEEIEKDDENDDIEGYESVGIPNHQTHLTSFLAVTQGIVDNYASFPTFASETLANATFWIAVRQEVYEYFINKRSPTMKFVLYDMGPVSPANRLVMHAAEVTKWNWGDKTYGEWIRLNEEHAILTRQFQSALCAIWEIDPDVVGGRVYPEIWYTSDAQVVSAQHLELARMILVAEKPSVCPPVITRPSSSSSAPRRKAEAAARRKVEAEVRRIILRLCGIAFSNLNCMPALVSAMMGISLYGDCFTNEQDRMCLLQIFDKIDNTHAWPTSRQRSQLLEEWKAIDGTL